jgi:hypothetical protein
MHFGMTEFAHPAGMVEVEVAAEDDIDVLFFQAEFGKAVGKTLLLLHSRRPEREAFVFVKVSAFDIVYDLGVVTSDIIQYPTVGCFDQIA